MSELSADVYVLETLIAHQIPIGAEVRVSLTDETYRRVRMQIRPFVDSIGMQPWEARELAAQLVEFADQAEQAGR